MTGTHCLTLGYLGTAELPCCNISGATITVTNPPAGTLRRGVCVTFHGLYLTAQAVPVPPALVDTYSPFGSLYPLSQAANLAMDGWVVINVPAPEDAYNGVPGTGVYNDVAADVNNGGRWVQTNLHAWDHIYQYIQNTYGNWPIMVVGNSLGAWRALEIAINRTSQIVGYVSSEPATIFETVGPVYTAPNDFALINWSGADIGPTALNAVPLLGMVGYSTTDTAVGWGLSTTATSLVAGTLTVPATAGSLSAALGSQRLLLTGLTGGTGRQVLQYTGQSATTFTGCTVVSGSGTINAGVTLCQQSTADAMITAGQAAGRPITRTSAASFHGIDLNQTGAYYAGTSTTIAALNTLTTVQMTTAQAATPFGSTQGLISGASAIQDTTGVWHALTFTGIASPNLTGAAIAGSGSIATGAPICNTGTAITGGFSNQGIPYWVNTVLSPNYPKRY